MIGEITYERIKSLYDAACEANNDFDHLAFDQEAFPCGGDCIGTNLAANLDFLREALHEICLELYPL